jgi:hypothetical protein
MADRDTPKKQSGAVVMKNGFKILDSDMHLREPANLWDKYMEPEWRERAPKILSSTVRSSAMVMIDGKILQGYQPTYRGGIFDATRIDKEIADYRADGFDAKTQLKRWIVKVWTWRRSIHRSVWAS